MPSELAGRDLDAAVAMEVLGWTDVGGFYKTITGTPKGKHPDDWMVVPAYHIQYEHAPAILHEIEQRGLAHEYVFSLAAEVLGFQPEPPANNTESEFEAMRLSMWRLLRATPEQICRAALAAVREAGA